MMMSFKTLSLIIVTYTGTSAVYTDLDMKAFEYLSQYGYLQTFEGVRQSTDESYLSDAVKKFQEAAGLKITGKVDKDTEQLFNTPRCGEKDRIAEFVTWNRKWAKRELTYRIFEYPTTYGLSQGDVDSETSKAFQMWQDVSNMRFRKKTSGPVDIEIRFVTGAHGDRYFFDGPGPVLGHAFFPGSGDISGDAHFDDAEHWSITPYIGTQLLHTLTHEFGHSLGLEHSREPGAIMHAFYKGWNTNLRLHQDDIQGIQYLYGKNRKENPVNFPTNDGPTSKPPRKDKKICHEKKIDAIVHSYGGISYVFIGDHYWMLIEQNNYNHVAPGYPRKISTDWPGLPGSIDAAVKWRARDLTYFFKGSQYWRFTGQTPSPGYPKDISNWPGMPKDLDAALEWGSNKDLYFFKGSQYWKYDTQTQRMDTTYPRDMSVWKGIPYNIDAAFQWKNGATYFFKSGKYWKLDDRTVSVARNNPPYPRNTGQWWYGCPVTDLPHISSKHGGKRIIDKEP